MGIFCSLCFYLLSLRSVASFASCCRCNRCRAAWLQYSGFVQGIAAENIYGKTFCDSQDFSTRPNKLDAPPDPPTDPGWWAKSGKKLDSHEGPQKVGYGGFIPRVYAENVHGNTFAAAQSSAGSLDAGEPRQTLSPVLDAATAATAPEDHSLDKHVPGYGGYIPGIYARGVFGATFENAQKQSHDILERGDHPRASAAADFESASFDAPKEQTVVRCSCSVFATLCW